MQSVNKIIYKIGYLFLGSLLISIAAFAQENSPFSRFGLGDLTNTQHILNKGMGGVSIAYSDPQIINFSNPASFANARIVTYDFGVTIDSRVLRSKSPVSKFNSTNFSPSYIGISAPISSKHQFGMALGFKPVTRISYNVIRSERLPGIDSVQSLFEGSGGMNEIFFGVGKKWKGFSVGVTTGYHFGKKENTTKRALVNDSIVYYKANYSTTTFFRGAYVTGGLQYEILLNDTAAMRREKKATNNFYHLRLGATAALGHTLKAEQTNFKETFDYDYAGGIYTLDSIDKGSTIKGDIKIPTTYSFGFIIQKTTVDPSGIYDKWAFGADFITAKWSDYRYFNQQDATVNSWQFKMGGQWTPNAKNIKNYFSRVTYRAGFNVGKDYINADGKELKTYSVSLGLGLPVRATRFSYQYSTVHTSLEFGKRGSAANIITENYFKLSVGLCLSDVWFIKRKYD